MIPGMYPRIVRSTLIQNCQREGRVSQCTKHSHELWPLTSAPHPRSRKTPRGGRKMARMILQMSAPVKGMLSVEGWVRGELLMNGIERRERVASQFWLLTFSCVPECDVSTPPRNTAAVGQPHPAVLSPSPNHHSPSLAAATTSHLQPTGTTSGRDSAGMHARAYAGPCRAGPTPPATDPRPNSM